VRVATENGYWADETTELCFGFPVYTLFVGSEPQYDFVLYRDMSAEIMERLHKFMDGQTCGLIADENGIAISAIYTWDFEKFINGEPNTD
jgi:hypothetical protein